MFCGFSFAHFCKVRLFYPVGLQEIQFGYYGIFAHQISLRESRLKRNADNSRHFINQTKIFHRNCLKKKIINFSCFQYFFNK